MTRSGREYRLSGERIKSAAVARLFLGSHWRYWHPQHALTFPSSRAVSHHASGGIPPGCAMIAGGFGSGRPSRGIAELRSSARASRLAGVGAADDLPAGIMLGRAGVVLPPPVERLLAVPTIRPGRRESRSVRHHRPASGVQWSGRSARLHLRSTFGGTSGNREGVANVL